MTLKVDLDLGDCHLGQLDDQIVHVDILVCVQAMLFQLIFNAPQLMLAVLLQIGQKLLHLFCEDLYEHLAKHSNANVAFQPPELHLLECFILS